MKKIQALIEVGEDNTYNVYMPENPLPFGAIGEGVTPQEACDDFLAVVNDFAADYPGCLEGVEFVFEYDTRALLNYYRRIFTLEGLHRITGIAAGQLSHYLNGYRHPSPRTARRITDAMRRFGATLAQLP